MKSKKLDQLYVSKAEFKKYDRRTKRVIIVDVKGKIAGFEGYYGICFGALALKRLKNSAKRAKRSTLGYFLDVLTK